MADVDRHLRELRATGLRHERQAQRAILAAWRAAWGTVTPLLDAVLAATRQALARGVRLTQAWYTRLPAYRSLLDGLTATLGRFAGQVGVIVAGVRQAVVQAVGPLAAAAVGAATQVAVGTLVAAPFLPVASPLALVSGLFKAIPRIVVDVGRALRQAVGRGVSAQQVVKEARQAANTAPVRALATSRANVHEAARDAALATYRLHPEAIGKWRWVASLGPRCCALCFARHGSLHPLTRSMNTHTGCRCVCAPEPRESVAVVESGDDVFRRLPRDVQRQVLGPGKLALWESGELASLSDLVQPTQSARYGPGMREKTLRELGAR
jgi:hypothetical protein